MSDSARVTSISAIRDFKAAIESFAEDARLALSEAQADVQRTMWWVKHDQLAHWQREHKKRSEKLAQAKADLFRAQLANNDTRTSAVVERKALARAQRLVEEAEEKIRRVRKWAQMLERESMLFRAQCQSLSSAVEGELPKAIARLGRMSESLHAYVSLAAPATGGEAAPADPASVREAQSTLTPARGQNDCRPASGVPAPGEAP